MLFLGIDPGGSGGLALISDRARFVDFEPMPESRRGILQVLRAFKARDPELRALLEQVSPMPGWGASGTMTFYKNIGHLEMALEVVGIACDELRPPAWQKLVGLVYPKRQKGERRDKNLAKRRAEQLFPTLDNITHASADALLLAEACRRRELGGLYG